MITSATVEFRIPRMGDFIIGNYCCDSSWPVRVDN